MNRKRIESIIIDGRLTTEKRVDLILKELEQSCREELNEFEDYVKENEKAAGEACGLSEGTQGCGEASFCVDVLREIRRFREMREKLKEV